MFSLSSTVFFLVLGHASNGQWKAGREDTAPLSLQGFHGFPWKNVSDSFTIPPRSLQLTLKTQFGSGKVVSWPWHAFPQCTVSECKSQEKKTLKPFIYPSHWPLIVSPVLQNHLSWKRPSRLSSPTINLTYHQVPSLNHVPHLKCLQGGGTSPFPWAAIPMLDCRMKTLFLISDIQILPNIQSKPPRHNFRTLFAVVRHR